MAHVTNELTIDTDTWTVQQWNMTIGDPDDDPAPAVLLFGAYFVGQALLHGIATCDDGSTLTVTPFGIATATSAPHDWTHIYELFPAVLSDYDPYDVPIYVGRWPD